MALSVKCEWNTTKITFCKKAGAGAYRPTLEENTVAVWIRSYKIIALADHARLVRIQRRKATCARCLKRWSSRFRCTAWKNRILRKFVKNVLFVVCDVTIFYQSISCAHKKRIWLWALISTKDTNRVSTYKTRLPLHFQKIILFSLHNVRRELSCRSRYSFMDMFSKETRIAASINEASSMPYGMKWSVVWVFKVFLTIYPRPAARSM